MDNTESEEYVFAEMEDGVQGIISHEEVCEETEGCVLQDGLTEVPVTSGIVGIVQEDGINVEIIAAAGEQCDEEERNFHEICIKEEIVQQPSSLDGDDEELEEGENTGDDESMMAAEALRQLGGMCSSSATTSFEEQSEVVPCPSCKSQFAKSSLSKHLASCGKRSKHCCKFCGEKFERPMDLNNHVVCHQVDRPHSCRTCGNLFKSKASLQSHMNQVHKKKKPHKCTICGAEFERPSSLSNHTKIHSYRAGRALNPLAAAAEKDKTNKALQWQSISYTVQDEDDNETVITAKLETVQEFAVMPNGEVAQLQLSQDSLNDDSDGPPAKLVKIQHEAEETDDSDMDSAALTCNICASTFKTQEELEMHESYHTGSTSQWEPIECSYCDKQFQDHEHLSVHQTTCTKKLMQNSEANGKWSKHECLECGKKFTTKQKMYRHQWIHRKKTFACEVCGIQFEKQAQLDEHRLAKHPGDTPFTCAECGKSFVSRQGLWEHSRTHAGSPMHFQCETCSKTFSSRQGYLIHNRTHTGERPYGCKFCWKSFRDGGTLRKHERIHTGERPHVCPLCSRAFNQKVVLREHVRWVHAAGKNEETRGPPFPCPLCGSLNQDRDELCAHIVKHSDMMIAEQKAKSNNNATAAAAPAPAKQPRQPKKRQKTAKASRKGSSSKLTPITNTTDTAEEEDESRSEQNAALLSIIEQDDPLMDSSGEEIAADKKKARLHNNSGATKTVLVVTDSSNNIRLLPNFSGSAMRLIAECKSGQPVVDMIEVDSKDDGTPQEIRLMSSGGGRQNNTLQLISKQNESLPVLAIPNTLTSSEEFSSQINSSQHASMVMGDDEVVLEESGQEEQIHYQMVEYEAESEYEEGDGLVCGICGESFIEKDSLLEHIKIHIQ